VPDASLVQHVQHLVDVLADAEGPVLRQGRSRRDQESGNSGAAEVELGHGVLPSVRLDGASKVRLH
jgi:hypothetical protein